MTNIKMYWVTVNEKQGYMQTVELPTGETLHFDEEVERIEFAPLEEYIGTPCEYYLDGEYQWTANLRKIDVVPGADHGRPDIAELRCLRFGPAL